MDGVARLEVDSKEVGRMQAMGCAKGETLLLDCEDRQIAVSCASAFEV